MRGGTDVHGKYIEPAQDPMPPAFSPTEFLRRLRSAETHTSFLLALASLDLACRDHRPDFSATFTTIAFDDSSLRWLEINT